MADYGDCWVRDTLPLLGHTRGGKLGGLCFRFNGWGGKFSIPDDEVIGRWITRKLDALRFESGLTLEGGALETNGRGTFITTASCALNENRNPGLTRDEFEAALDSLVSVDRVIWIDRGLEYDHTDGHVDMIARFVTPETVLCMAPTAGAPNERVLREVEQTLRRGDVDVITVPAPSASKHPDQIPLPATYCNFYVANAAVIVPTYGVKEDRAALIELQNAFPEREVVGLPARDLLWGGGAFHCVTQPQPTRP
jgi:agmatine deiminase